MRPIGFTGRVKLPRQRMIKPSFWTDSIMLSLSDSVRLFYIGTWNFADDEGRLEDDALALKACIFPHQHSVARVRGFIEALVGCGRLVRYSARGRSYLQIAFFKRHQKINRPFSSVLPAPADEIAKKTGLPQKTDEILATSYFPKKPQEEHKKKQKKLPPKQLQKPEKFTEYSLNTHGGLTDDSLPKYKDKEKNPPINPPSPFFFPLKGVPGLRELPENWDEFMREGSNHLLAVASFKERAEANWAWFLAGCGRLWEDLRGLDGEMVVQELRKFREYWIAKAEEGKPLKKPFPAVHNWIFQAHGSPFSGLRKGE